MNPPGLPSVEDLVLQERLKLLAIATTVSGATKAIMVSFLIFHFAFLAIAGICIPFIPAQSAKHTAAESTNSEAKSSPGSTELAPKKESPFAVGMIFGALALFVGLIILAGWTLGGLLIYSGHCIRKRKHLVFIQIMGAIQCIFIPYGTLIGIFTFYTLGTERAKELFNAR